MSEIILLFTIWLVSGDKLTEQHEKPFASTMECTLAGQIEALKKVKEYEAQGKEATVHFTCAPKIDERQCERLDSPPFTAGSFFAGDVGLSERWEEQRRCSPAQHILTQRCTAFG